MKLYDLLDPVVLDGLIDQRYVSCQQHPTEPLAILNYTQRCQYDRVWNPVSRQCRGLIFDYETLEVVARPWPKFFNAGEHTQDSGLGVLDIGASVVVTNKCDGSLGILYPQSCGRCGGSGEEPQVDDHYHGHVSCDRCDGSGREYAIATRGSFTSEQALHATEVYHERYSHWTPLNGTTTLFEIVYPQNRVVVDYRDLDDLILLNVLDTETGDVCSPRFWPGLRVAEFRYRTLAEALEAEPRPNAEGLVVHFLDGPCAGERVKLKQEDYIALHRILTGTNARNVWEVAAVRACSEYVAEPKHWGSFLGIDPARAEECLSLGDEWLAAVPDEFHEWVRTTFGQVEADAYAAYSDALEYAERASEIAERAARFESVRQHPLVSEIMRVASADGFEKAQAARNQLYLRCWREACPEPTAPFARSEAIA